MQSIVSLYPIKPWTHVMCPHHTEKGGQVVIACHTSRGGERTWFMDQLGCYGPAASIVVLPSRHAKGNDDPVNYIRIVASSPEASQSMERSHLWWQQDPVCTGTSLGASSSTLTDLDDGMERRGDLSWGDRIFQILNLTEKSNGRDNLLIIDHSRGQYSNLYYRGRLN